MTVLSNRLVQYIQAAFTGIWIVSHEHADALAEIATLCRQEKWTLASWDIERGLLAGAQAATAGTTDPLAAIRSMSALASKDSSALLVLPNFHRFCQSTEIVQALARQIQEGKQNRTFVIILSPVVQIPVELEKSFVVIEHDLPDKTQLQQIAASIATAPQEMPQGPELDRLLEAASGLTRFEAEGAFALSLVRHEKLTSQAVWELKEGMLKKSGLLTLHRGKERFADLGGLETLKPFCLRALQSNHPQARPRGVLLLSPPGCGKSHFCKCLGNETGRPTLILDIGALMGSLVGSTEQNIRQALRIIDAMAPAVVFVDECEKALSGVASSGQTDSGVSARLFGTLLQWLSDHSSDVFVVMTANDISRLPPEMSRAERFDGVFMLDLPGSAEKQAIWPIHLSRYGLDHNSPRPDDRDWTGAEIASCCRLAALLDLPLKEAARNVVPVPSPTQRAWRSCGIGRRGGAWTPAGPGSTPAAPSCRALRLAG